MDRSTNRTPYLVYPYNQQTACRVGTQGTACTTCKSSHPCSSSPFLPLPLRRNIRTSIKIQKLERCFGMAVDEFGREIRLDASAAAAKKEPPRKRSLSTGSSSQLHPSHTDGSHSNAISKNGGGGSGRTAAADEAEALTIHDVSSRYHRSIRGLGFPCERYVDIEKPLLCERVWKDMMMAMATTQRQKKEVTGMVKEDLEVVSDIRSERDNQLEVKGDDETMDEGKENQNLEENQETRERTSLNEPSYKEYLQDYAKLYLQNFLNAHLDDEFFFQQYSPLECSNALRKANERRVAEARIFQKEYEEKRLADNNNESDAISQLILHSYESKFSMITFSEVPCHIGDAIIETALQAQAGMAENHVLIVLSTPVNASSRRLKRTVFALTNHDAITDALARKDDLEIRIASSGGAVDETTSAEKLYVRIAKIRAPVDASAISPSAALTLPTNALADMNSAIELKSKLTTLSLMIARALDAKLNLDDGIDSILSDQQQQDADLEAVAAYLRRIHYFDISHGRQLELVDILNGAGYGLSGGVLSVEKLSQSLNDIMSSDQNEASNFSKDDQTVIESIRQAEQLATVNFLSAHTLVSDNNRARCAFRYCAKLFKSVTFLEKHLIKKHGPELRREQLKVHDSYIMQRWENDPSRRCLPFICIDCGHDIGFREVQVTGPIKDLRIEDPEPKLKQQYEELMQKRREQQQSQAISRHSHKPLAIVDVDDMVDEKVELQFDKADADVVAAAFNKRKKSSNTSRKKRKKMAI